ncbi:hypothetical protein B0H34DRAFT_636072, partial [Crassisporium funariophilum]
AVRNVADSQLEGASGLFMAIHFDFYNRYSKRGDGTPADIDPATIGHENVQRVNISQMLPRACSELKLNPDQYVALQNAFAGMFEWIRQQLEILLPNNYDLLSAFVDILPCSEIAPAYPFSGFVLNINVTTRIHQDWKDDSVCLVVTISDCVSGEL